MIKYQLYHYLMESAERYPKKAAIKEGGRTITYRGLDELSDKLASMLISIGLPQRDVVGIYLNKSLEAIVSFFAVLKANGTYIPLDAHYSPLERIKDIIKLSEMRYLITDAEKWEEVCLSVTEEEEELFASLQIILVDTLICGGKGTQVSRKGNCRFVGADFPRELQKANGNTDDDVAYILYTSGSTGIPKGVMITHLNAMMFINWALSYFKPNHQDVFANHAPLHFDLSVFDIYVSLAVGGTVDLVPFHISGNPRALIEWMAKERISYWYSVPSVWVTILNYACIQKEELVHLKKILFAGEVFPPKYLKRLMESLPDAEHYNLYGPTETNVCTFYHVESTDVINDRPVPIGKACENMEVVVLNEEKEPVSVNGEGELYVKGSCVTKGYYKDRVRTEEVLVESPISYHNGARLYRTGDIVRRCREDTYEYIGRKDLMVKCAGFRIELEEIETALVRNDCIQEAAVVPHYREERGSTSLYAFVKLKRGKKYSILDIREYCKKTLPHYMIPEVVEIVKDIPKNTNGKRDRRKISRWVK